MTRHGTEQNWVTVVQSITPFLMVLLHAIPVTLTTCSLRSSNTKRSLKLKLVIVVDMILVVVTYITEVGLILGQLSEKSHLTNTGSNVYSLASILVWSILIASLLASSNQPWMHFYASWAVNLVAETIISAVYASTFGPSTSIEKAQLSMHFLRLILIMALPLGIMIADGWKLLSRDEESAPLLASHTETSERAEPTTATNGYGYGTADGTANGDSLPKPTTNVEPEESESAKQERENLARITKRLEEEGSWWSYAMSFSIFIPHIWPKRETGFQYNMTGVAICIVAIRFLNVLVPRQLGVVFDTLNRGSPHETFFAVATYLLLVWLDSYEGLRALRNWLWSPVENNAYLNLDCASFNHIMQLSADFHDSKQSGELYRAMSQGHSVVQLLEKVVYEFLPIIIDLTVACIYFYYLFDAYMALIAATTIVVYLGVSTMLTSLQTVVRRIMLVVSRKKYQTQYDTMGNWRTVVYFNRTDHSRKVYAEATRSDLAIFLRSSRLHIAVFGIQSFILDLGLAAACFLAIYQVLYSGKTPGAFLVLLTYWAGLAGPLNSISLAHRSLLRNLINAEQLLQLFRQQPTVQSGPHQLHVTQGHIDFTNIHFSYDGTKKTIDNLTFHASPGQKIALIGETGGGKSTILKLLFRFYDVSEGSILIDGQDIKDVTLESLRENIGVVPQDPSLFNDTIMNNVRYARLDATDGEVMDACRDAAIHDKIMTFTKGYDTKAGEHGVRLSGGELQRVAVARAILKNPKIVLLDEATSSVDSETEAKIQEALGKLAKNRTTFVVAHRLSTIIDADRIIVIKDGTILEQGTPAELMEKKGKYYHLWTKQMGIVNIISNNTDDSEALLEQEAEPNGQHHLFSSTLKYPLNHQQSLPKMLSTPEKVRQPVPARGSSLNPTHPPSGGKSFRPEAPEFIPYCQRATVASAGTSTSELPLYSHHHDDPEGASERKSRSRKRKAKLDLNHYEATRPSEVSAQTAAASSKPLDDVEPKRPRFGRRFQAKSEPHLVGLHQSQADGTIDLDRSTTLNSYRRVTAPSDPSSGLLLSDRTNFGPRRRRQRHWRSKNREASKLAAAAENHASSSTAPPDWSSESAAADGLNEVLFTSPMEGVPIAEGSELMGGRVRFALGS